MVGATGLMSSMLDGRRGIGAGDGRLALVPRGDVRRIERARGRIEGYLGELRVLGRRAAVRAVMCGVELLRIRAEIRALRAKKRGGRVGAVPRFDDLIEGLGMPRANAYRWCRAARRLHPDLTEMLGADPVTKDVSARRLEVAVETSMGGMTIAALIGVGRQEGGGGEADVGTEVIEPPAVDLGEGCAGVLAGETVAAEVLGALATLQEHLPGAYASLDLATQEDIADRWVDTHYYLPARLTLWTEAIRGVPYARRRRACPRQTPRRRGRRRR